MTSALSGKGIAISACGQRRTPSLCNGSLQWAAARARGARASAPSLSLNRARSESGRPAYKQRLRLRSRPFASFVLGLRRCRRTLPVQLPAEACAALGQAASFVPMRYNHAAHPDARANAVLCKGHRARAGGCER